jgi:GntR family transcriptional regulator
VAEGAREPGDSLDMAGGVYRVTCHYRMTSLPNIPVDRSSPVPFWFQVAQALEKSVGDGVWAPGERLASEAEICRHFGVSRTTVRQALARLEQEGMVERRKGFGTFVAAGGPGVWLVQSQEGLFGDETRLGRNVTSRILRREVTELPEWATTALELEPGTRGVVIERLRSVDAKLALVVTDCLPAALADTVLALDANDSLYARLEAEHHLTVAGGRRFLEALRAGTRLATLLGTDRGAPLAFIESVSWDADLRPFHCYRSWLRTDRLRVELQVSGSGKPRRALAETGGAAR